MLFIHCKYKAVDCLKHKRTENTKLLDFTNQNLVEGGGLFNKLCGCIKNAYIYKITI